MDVPHKQLAAEAFHFVVIDITNDMPSDLEKTAKSLMVGRKKQKVEKILIRFLFFTTFDLCPDIFSYLKHAAFSNILNTCLISVISKGKFPGLAITAADYALKGPGFDFSWS